MSRGIALRSAAYLAAALIYVVGFAIAIPFYIDEAYTVILASDRSAVHMLSALEAGADGSFPVHALYVFLWDKIFGSSELSLRLSSGLFVILFVWHSVRRLSGCFSIAK